MMNNVISKNYNILKVKHWHFVTLCLIVYDVLAIAASYFAALMLRFDMRYSSIPQEYLGSYIRFIPVYAGLCIIVFAAMKLYRSIWRFASYDEVVRLLAATCITAAIHIVLITAMFHRMPISYFMMGITLQLVSTLGVRFAYRFILLLRSKQVSQSGNVKRVMCIGGGRAGQMVVRELKTSRQMSEVPVCIIDDNANKWGRYIEGVRVYGGRDRILEAVEKYSIEKIYFAIPSATAGERRDFLNI